MAWDTDVCPVVILSWDLGCSLTVRVSGSQQTKMGDGC